MTIEYKQSAAALVSVALVTSAGAPVAGTVYTSVTATVLKSDGTTAALTVGSTDWAEITTGAFSGQGIYTLKIPASATGVTGILIYAVSVAGANVYKGRIKVVANEEVDTYTRLGAPVSASVSADILSIKNDTGLTVIRIGTPVSSSIAADIANVRGSQSLDLSIIAGGAAFSASSDNLHNIQGTISSGGVSPSALASAVWDELLSGHIISGSSAVYLKNVFGLVSGVNNKTSNLPTDPASQAAIIGSNTALSLTAIAGVSFASGSDSLHALASTPSNVWNEFLSGHTTAGTAGADLGAIYTKTQALPSDPASASTVLGQINAARDAVRGAQNLDISTIAGGTAFNSSSDNLHNIEVTVTAGGFDPTPIATAVWDVALSNHLTGSTTGYYLNQTQLKTANLPASPASTSDVTGLKGAGNYTLTDLAGTGFVSTDALHAIKAAVLSTPPSAGSIASAVWEENLSTHNTAGTAGKISQDIDNNSLILLGLSKQNFVLDNTVYNSRGLMTAGRIRIFSTATDANNGTNVLASYTITTTAESSPNDNLVANYKVTKD